MLPVSFHFWLRCPWLAQRSRAAPGQPEAAPFLTYSAPLPEMLHGPLLGFISAETACLLLVNQFLVLLESDAGWAGGLAGGIWA